MSDAQSVLGVDLEETVWQDWALCQGYPINEHYDDYEADENVARLTDERCLSCPVMVQCLEQGIDNNEWGVWGGIYLVSGKPDPNRNSHKTQEVWEAIKERLGDSVL